MAVTLTANYGWTKPDPGASSNTWGNFLNTDLDQIDNQVFVNNQGSTPVGTVTMFAGSSSVAAPTNWLFCQGQSISTAAPNDKLFAVIGYTYGGSGANFNLPNLTSKFPMGVAAVGAGGATGGEATHVLTTPEIPSHTHTVTQTPHSHADSGHTHTVNDPGHAHSGVVRFGSGSFSLGTNNPQIQSGNTDADATGITIASATSNLAAANANVTIAAAGGGGAHNNLPPFLAMNFIIRYQ